GDLGREPVYQELRRSGEPSNTRPTPSGWKELREQYAEDYRVKQLESQEAAWRRASRLGEYLEAARAQLTTLSPGLERTQAEEWVEWAEGHVARIHLMAQPLRLPDIPEPRPDDLKPFLCGWSPYGPNLYWLGPIGLPDQLRAPQAEFYRVASCGSVLVSSSISP
ncbi:hypothetical protein AB0O86_37210, partial [Streptomyces hirsutus]